MNTTWKKYKEFIILGILGAIIFVLVLILLFSEMDKIIQSELIVILVFITLYYAIQTRRLVEEEKRKTIADFAERRLQDFHLPLKHSFIMLHVLLNHPDIFLDSVSTFNSELVKLFFKYDYMVKAETDDAFHNLVDVLDKEKEVIKKVKQADWNNRTCSSKYI